MDISVTEMQYPLGFRSQDARLLGDNLQHRHSVEFIGMKRVGISNFLRFFLYHKDIKRQYLPQDGKNLFIPVDLNDLIEREIFPFWRLTFKRIVDTVESNLFDTNIKQKISDLFVNSIQSGDLFLTFDGVRESLVQLVKANIYPTIFLLRFDRLSDAVTPEFFNNLQSLQDATNHKLSYVFTSYRELEKLAPNVLSRQTVSSFTNTLYIKPAGKADMDIIFETIAEKYKLSIPPTLKDVLIDLSGGHLQYLQISLTILHELTTKKKLATEDEIIAAIESDERITLQSEELWESLSPEERDTAKRVDEGKKITTAEKEAAKYLWNTGFVVEEHGLSRLFSPLLSNFVESGEKKKNPENVVIEFSKKEHMLFELLSANPNIVVEREKIVEDVWPEYKEYGVSDWSVDRLVARVRQKLKKQRSDVEIVTVRTRGYKLVTK